MQSRVTGKLEAEMLRICERKRRKQLTKSNPYDILCEQDKI